MALARVSVLCAVAIAGCIEPDLVRCGDLLCPGDRICTPAGCTTAAAAAACDGRADGTPCTTTEIANGGCGSGACHSITCGDGQLDPGEVCEDGNTLAADGCSATCESIEVCGNQIVDVVNGEECDAGTPGLSGDGCSSTCRGELATWRDVSPALITPRAGAAMVTDDKRNRVVLFGGYDGGGARADTWEFGGSQWNPRFPTQSPPARYRAAVAFDRVNNVVVLFGGIGIGGYLGDTWTWDGTTWTQQVTPVAPLPRGYAAMAFDSARGRVVLEGGVGAGTYLAETWEWDGVAWMPRTDVVSPAFAAHAMAFVPASGPSPGIMVMVGNDGQTWTYDGTSWQRRTIASPPAVQFAAMTYDLARDRLVWFGGQLPGGSQVNDLWELDRTLSSWTHATPASPPIARREAGFAYLPALIQTVMFGGVSTAGSTTLPPDTNTWNGTLWTTVPEPPNAPPPRSFGRMTYDPARGRALLYGGYNYVGSGYLDDTWEWRDRRWLRLPASGPGARSNQGMAYDVDRDRLVMFGGATAPATYGAGTWEWDGADWAERAPAISPSVRSDPAMVFDETSRRTLLFGGTDATGVRDDTWTWDGATWTKLSPSISPEARFGAAVAYDRRRDRAVLFGGAVGTAAIGGTWEWDGSTWIECTPAMSPPDRLWAGMTFDERLAEVVLFGGSSGSGYLGDVWSWDGTRWREVPTQGLATPRVGPLMAYDSVQRATIVFGGETFINVDLGSTSTLSFEAALAPVEGCNVATTDDDGDGLAGCADPDCWGRCAPLCGPRDVCATGLPRCGDGSCGPIEDHLLCPADCP